MSGHRVGPIDFRNNLSAINVTSFGATGSGLTDDTAAIQSASDALAVKGGTLYFPTGTYLISSPIRLYTNTRAYGDGPGSLIIASSTWVDKGFAGFDPYAIFVNFTYSASVVTDHDIRVEFLAFDWSRISAGVMGSAHTVRFRKARAVAVSNCTGNQGGDLCSYIGVDNGLMAFNTAIGHTNCPYDSWGGSTDIRVIGNYAKGPAVQMACFNGIEVGAGAGGDPDAAVTSDGYICSNNEFHNTGSGFASVNFDTLGTNCVVNNVLISGNLLYGCTIVGRGTVNDVIIQSNIQTGNVNIPIIITADSFGKIPANVQILSNSIINPQIAGSDVIQCQCNNYLVDGNLVTGSSFVSAVATTTFVGVVGMANNFSTGSDVQVRGSAWNSTNNASAAIPNNTFLDFKDTAGTAVRIVVDASNNLTLYGHSGAGALLTGMTWAQRATGAAVSFYPTTSFGRLQGNFVRAQGAASGSTPFIAVDANSTDTDIDFLVSGKGTAGVRFTGHTGSTTPVHGTDILSSQSIVWKNSGDSSVKLYYDDAGTLKSVVLT